MKKEFKRIKAVSKKIIGRENFKKVKKITDPKERTEGLKYLVSSKLQLRLQELEHHLSRVKKEDRLKIEVKLNLLKSKIKIFNSTHTKKDYMVLHSLIKEIADNLKNV